jgi:hypothetical protein
MHSTVCDHTRASKYGAAGKADFRPFASSVHHAARIIAGVCLMGMGGQVMAADTDTTGAAATAEVEEIVVTGSSNAQKLDSSSLPVTLLSSEEIAKTGR